MADSLFSSMDVSASGLTAERARMNIIAQNIANANTTRRAGVAGSPYRRKEVLFRTLLEEGSGVMVDRIVEDPTPFRMVHDAGHPDADESGFVQMPNVNVPLEMVDMISASRAYQANLTVMRHSRAVVESALSLLK